MDNSDQLRYKYALSTYVVLVILTFLVGECVYNRGCIYAIDLQAMSFTSTNVVWIPFQNYTRQNAQAITHMSYNSHQLLFFLTTRGITRYNYTDRSFVNIDTMEGTHKLVSNNGLLYYHGYMNETYIHLSIMRPDLTFLDTVSLRAMPSSAQRSRRYVCTFIHESRIFYMFRDTTYFHDLQSVDHIYAIRFNTESCLTSSVVSHSALVFKNNSHLVAISIQYIIDHGELINTNQVPPELGCDAGHCTAVKNEYYMLSSATIQNHQMIASDQQGFYYVVSIEVFTSYYRMIILIVSCCTLIVVALLSVPLIKFMFDYFRIRKQLYTINENNRKWEAELLRGGSFRSYGSTSNHRNWIIKYEDIKFDRRIAEGSFGVLFRATLHGETVAVKMIKYEQNSDDYINEIQMLRTLKHRNVLKLIGISLHQRKMFIITEYCEHGSIDNIFKEPTLDFQRKLEILADVVRGMIYLHEHEPQVLHCDLKLANLLLDSSDTVKVCDFGQSMYVWPTTSNDQNTRGTYRYLCPEMVLKKGAFTSKGDVYSFALCMYELFFQQVAFQNVLDQNPMMDPLLIAVMVARERVRPEIPERVYSDGEVKFLEVMKMCWEHDPDDRPSFVELYHEIFEIARLDGIHLLNHDEWEDVQ